MGDRIIKVLIIGESGVGKSSLIRRFVDDEFDDNHDVTIGVDFKTKLMNIDGVEFKLAIWDTAGAERFRSLTPSFYRNAKCAILVYDVTNRESLQKLDSWLQELENYSNNRNIPTMVVGNKIDMERVILRDDGLKFARKHRLLFLETSAKNNVSVADVFEEIVRKTITSDDFNQQFSNGINVAEGEEAVESTCRC